MDRDTFVNHIINLGKQDFNILCRLVLNEALGLNAVNVDGKGDGGADFIELDSEGGRKGVVYQVTTQKSDVKNKAYRDAKKAIEHLKATRYFFLPTYNLSETDAHSLEFTIEDELGIPSRVFTPKIMAEYVIKYKLVRKFYELTGVDDGTRQSKDSVDYLEMALHTYTFLSSDARNLKSQIYDDSLLFILSGTEVGMTGEQLITNTKSMLNLSDAKNEVLKGRIDYFMQKGLLKKAENGLLALSPETAEDILQRKCLYNSEQSTFYHAQQDLLKDYHVQWDMSDSKQSSVWIANDIIDKQISGLESAGAQISNPLYRNVKKHGLDKLRELLLKKHLNHMKLEDVVGALVSMASSHPLVVKVVRASVYLSLEGTRPLAAAKSLGVNSWDEVNMLIEPTIGIPHICSLQYKGSVNANFDNAIMAVKRARELGINMQIPYIYIKECAGHLLLARDFNGIELNPDEMQFSKNAFVANYYALKLQGVSLPDTFLDYLATFSPAILTEHDNQQSWMRAITTDIQSILIQSGIEYLEIPSYEDGGLAEIDGLYRSYLPINSHKSNHLIKNDVIVLKGLNDSIVKNSEHWIMLTYDNSLIKVSAERFNNVWINNPYYFLDMTELTRELPDTKFCSLVHSLAQYSERTLSAGARIIDRIVYYASDKMQNWEFKEELEKFKKDLINSSRNITGEDIDSKTDEFLQNHGVTFDEVDEDNEADIQNDSV